MILIGLLLVLVAVAGGAAIFVGTSSMTGQADKIDITVLGVTVSMPPLSLAVAGALVVLLLWLGWAVLRGGAKRSARLRREAKEQARIARETPTTPAPTRTTTTPASSSTPAGEERQWTADRGQAGAGTTDR